MDRDTQSSPGPLPAPGQRDDRYKTGFCGLIAAITLVGLVGLGFGTGVFRGADRDGLAQDHAPTSQTANGDVLSKLKLFNGPGWNRPDVVLVLTGEMHGYWQPCGCSYPQYGGLTRRANLIQALRERGWPVVAADLGDINHKPTQKFGLSGVISPQTDLKFKMSMESLHAMGVTAVSFGEYETTLPTLQALGSYWLNNASPRVLSANLKNRQPGGLFSGSVVDTALAPKQAGGPQVGIFGLTGPSVEKKIKDPAVEFDRVNTPQILLNCLQQLKTQKADLIVLLYQGDKSEAVALAQYCAQQAQQNPNIPPLNVILHLATTSLPPAQPAMVGNTMLIEVGHKGQYVGVVGASRTNGQKSFALHYELVTIGPELETPKEKVTGHKVMQIWEEYAEELMKRDYLKKFKQVPHEMQIEFPKLQVEYAGSARCKTCHEEAYKIWDASDHSHAYQKLVNAKRPSNRQFDGECIVCHTVGFGYKTGFDATQQESLKNVGCESCHGPSLAHVRDHKNKALFPLMNPFKFRGVPPQNPAAQQARMNNIGDFCMKCHDSDNDTKFDILKAWPKIIHMNPPVAAGK